MLTIQQIHQLLKHSFAFIGMDSGVFHIAQATNIPAIPIFTNVSPEKRLVERDSITIPVVPDLECRGCYHRMFPAICGVCLNDAYCYECVDAISPEKIINAFEEVESKQK